MKLRTKKRIGGGIRMIALGRFILKYY